MGDNLVKTIVMVCAILEILVSLLTSDFILASWAFTTLVWCSLYYSLKNELDRKE